MSWYVWYVWVTVCIALRVLVSGGLDVCICKHACVCVFIHAFVHTLTCLYGNSTPPFLGNLPTRVTCASIHGIVISSYEVAHSFTRRCDVTAVVHVVLVYTSSSSRIVTHPTLQAYSAVLLALSQLYHTHTHTPHLTSLRF